ncbi:MAG: hypothetical protein OHK005_06060 [Candidatus Methylacidiphilales bacterium]
MSERTPGKNDSIPELMKPSVAGPYVPPPQEPLGLKPKDLNAARKDAPSLEPTTPVVSKPTEISGVPPTGGPPPIPAEAVKPLVTTKPTTTPQSEPVVKSETQTSAESSSPAEKDEEKKEKEIEEAFARHKDGPVGRPEDRADAGEEKPKGSSLITRTADGKIRIEKLERTERRSQRAKAKVTLERVSPASGAGTQPARRPFRYGLEIGAFLAALLVVALGIFIYLSLRETRVQVAITPGDIQLESEAWLVYDFSDRIDFVRADLERRKGPFKESIAEVEKNLSAAKADLAGREARMRLLREAMEQDQAEMPKTVEAQQEALRKLWAEEGPRLDREFDARQEQVNRSIRARAQELGLRLEVEEDLEAPEVYVNAFRLALYNPPKGIDATAERQWAEEQLKAWKAYEESFAERQNAIREQAIALRAEGAPKLEAVQERITARQVEIDALAEEMKEFQEEVARHENTKAGLLEEMQSLSGPFISDLAQTPSEYVHARWPIENGWRIDVRRLDKEPNLPPGSYRLMLRGNRDGEPVWAFKEFTIEEFETTQIKVSEADFTPVRSLLEKP